MLSLIAFDADDTLWHNLIHFDNAQKQFGKMFANFMPASEATSHLMQLESQNIKT